MRVRKPKLVDNWKQAWKWFSVHCMTIAGAIHGAWLVLPDDMKASLPIKYVAALTVTLMLCGVAGRLVDQEQP
jgi:RsiW-degrading membrane proteinase PrsW (M82 family)